MAKLIIVPVIALTMAGCAALEQLRMFVQPPRFAEAQDHPAEIRLLGPSFGRPLGGAGVRVWATVESKQIRIYHRDAPRCASLRTLAPLTSTCRSDSRSRPAQQRPFRSTSRSALPNCPASPT